MRNKFLIIGLAMGSLSFSQSQVDSTCVGITTKGTNCKIKINVDSTKYCHYHLDGKVFNESEVKSKICGENTTKNTPCKSKTKHSSGKCHHHRD
jgi:hypothetical protein